MLPLGNILFLKNDINLNESQRNAVEWKSEQQLLDECIFSVLVMAGKCCTWVREGWWQQPLLTHSV